MSEEPQQCHVSAMSQERPTATHVWGCETERRTKALDAYPGHNGDPCGPIPADTPIAATQVSDCSWQLGPSCKQEIFPGKR